MSRRHLIVVAPKRILAPLVAHLGRAKVASEIVPIIRSPLRRGSDDPYGVLTITKNRFPKVGGLLLVTPRHVPVLGAIPSPVANGIPVGIVQADSISDLTAWCEGLQFMSKNRQPRSYVALAMNTAFFKSQAALLAKNIRRAYRPENGAKNMFADTLTRDDLLRELAKGSSLVTYLGHGSHQGWSGYRGVRGRDVVAAPRVHPCGVVISISCDTLLEHHAGISFGSRFIAEGRACAFLGAAGKVKIDSYAAFIRLMGKVFADRPHTLGELMVNLDKEVADVPASLRRDWNTYRLVGNPFQQVL